MQAELTVPQYPELQKTYPILQKLTFSEICDLDEAGFQSICTQMGEKVEDLRARSWLNRTRKEHNALTCCHTAMMTAPKVAPVRHILKISSLNQYEVLRLIDRARDMKAHPENYYNILRRHTLLMLFEKPSLRTRVSFEVGMEQLGGHAIYYSIADSPLGKKETHEDTAKCLSRFCEVVMARLNKRTDLYKMAGASSIPIINALDDYAHPCQILCDLQTIVEKKGSLKGIKLAYFGDCRNNVTYDLMRAGALMGFTAYACGPQGPDYDVEPEVLDECKNLCAVSGGQVVWTHNTDEAIKDADVVYCDSWMSYHISKELMGDRIKTFTPYQVTNALLAKAKKDVIFMNCLPAARGMEQLAEVIDGPHSIVFDQAENRLHAQKALLCFLVKGML